jgi:dipeptidyl aminopeptidase/acylaminoacyl peptidase
MPLLHRFALLLLATSAAAVQQPVLPVPAAVKTDGIPPIPMSIVDAVSPYGEFRQARFLAWHPTRRQMLIQTAFANVQQVHEVLGPGAARTQLTFFRDGVTGGASYDPSGRFVLIRKDTGGGTEAMQLFRRDADGRMSQLTDSRSRNGPPVWAHRHPWIAYDSTLRDGRNRDLYVMDPSDGSGSRLVAEVEGAWSVLDWSPDDRELLALETVSASAETYVWRVDVETGRKTPVTDRRAGRAFWSEGQYAAGGGAVFLLGDRSGEIPRVWRVELATRNLTAITTQTTPIETFALSPDGAVVAVVEDRGAASALVLLSSHSTEAAQRVRHVASLPPGVISRVEWHPNGSEVAVEFAGARTFRDVFSVAFQSGRVERWTTSEIGGAEPQSLPDAEIIQWPSFDGRQISGVFYRPPARFTGKRPVIVNVHGGPASRERPRSLGRSNYFRNEMGIAIIYPNIRGSSGFGRTFEQLDDGLKREDAVKDIGALLDWIARQPDLDPQRVMITGSSYGGYITLASAIAYSTRIRCAFEGFGITDFISYFESTEESRRIDRRAEYGDPSDPKVREFLTRISPISHAAEIKVPLFVAQGAKDTRVPLSQAEALVKAVRANGTPLWYVVYTDAGHEEFTRATNDFNIYAWVMFVREYLVN